MKDKMDHLTISQNDRWRSCAKVSLIHKARKEIGKESDIEI